MIGITKLQHQILIVVADTDNMLTLLGLLQHLAAPNYSSSTTAGNRTGTSVTRHFLQCCGHRGQHCSTQQKR